VLCALSLLSSSSLELSLAHVSPWAFRLHFSSCPGQEPACDEDKISN
jgi:hypothetical protein